MIQKIKNLLKWVLWEILVLFPVKKNRILFSSYYGRGYGDNLKYIANELLNSGYDLIWSIKNPQDKKELPKEIRACKFRSLQEMYYLATAAVWIDNCRKAYFKKKKNQLYIQTWHGGGAQKKSEKDVIDKLESVYVKMAENDGKNSDIMISDSRYMTELYHRAFWFDGAVFECGYPRYDLFFGDVSEIKRKVLRYYHIDEDKGVLLYAPTFRADKSFDAYNIDFPRLRKNLRERFHRDFVILVHLHPIVADKEGIGYDGVNVINSTFYPDTQELLAASDLLIGDYSSINYDFCIRKLPVFRYVSDLEKYRNDRDLYFAFDAYPFPYAKNNDELEALILHFDEEQYLSQLNLFMNRLGSVNQGNASEEIAGLISDFISLGRDRFYKKNRNKFVYKQGVL